MHEETHLWLETADQDLRAARLLLEGKMHSRAAFHLQQAAEKSLKSLLCEHGERSRSHSSLEVMSELGRKGENFPEGFDADLRRLDRCYIDSRYPNGIGQSPESLYDAKMLEELMACCMRVMELVRSRIS